MEVRHILSGAALRAWGERRPHAEPFAARAAVPLMGWETLERVLAGRADLLLADRGSEIGGAPPRSLQEARRCLDAGVSIVVRRAHDRDPALSRLALAFARQFAATVHIQVFVTPADHQTFGWHYDDEHVFLLQTLGCKQYWFCRNTVVLDTSRSDFGDFARERSPLMSATLRAGDLLYLPRGTWHKAQAVQESMHLSVGVR